MKIKSNIYGVFYKDGKKWRGPIDNELLTVNEIEDGWDSIKIAVWKQSKLKKKKTRLFRQVWKSVKS